MSKTQAAMAIASRYFCTRLATHLCQKDKAAGRLTHSPPPRSSYMMIIINILALLLRPLSAVLAVWVLDIVHRVYYIAFSEKYDIAV
jgi:hypothetical protein